MICVPGLQNRVLIHGGWTVAIWAGCWVFLFSAAVTMRSMTAVLWSVPWRRWQCLPRPNSVLSEADDLIKRLGLEPHPEGGHFRETFRDETSGRRPYSTAILFLLKAGEV